MVKFSPSVLIAQLLLLVATASCGHALEERENVAPLGTSGMISHTSRGDDCVENPQEIYDKAWKAIKDTYFDPTFNGQDWNRWKRRYDGKLESAEDAFEAIDTMLASLAPPCFNTFWVSDNRFCDYKWDYLPKGIGIKYIPTRDGAIVHSLFANSPAAGESIILPGDIIVEVDGVDARGLSSKKLSDMIQGRPDTVVSLTVLRNEKRRSVSFVRSWQVSSSFSAVGMLDKNIGYINVEYVSDRTLEKLAESIKELKRCKGLIIDLRNCHMWSSNSAACRLADSFLTSGVIAKFKDRNGEHQEKANFGAKFHMPLVILIGEQTEGNIELFCAALQQNKRAMLVGQKTKGKPNTYSHIFSLGYQRIFHIKSREHLTPSGESFDDGIMPDKVILVSKADMTGGKGPWWYAQKNLSQFSEKPQDKQLQGAIEALAKQLTTNRTHSNST